MLVVPGTKVQLNFYACTPPLPPRYYAKGEGSLILASVNARNSDGLCVGLGGVNHGFHEALTNAGQKRVNLTLS